MIGLLLVLVILLALGLVGSVVEGVFLADQVDRLRAERDRAVAWGVGQSTVVRRQAVRLRLYGHPDPDGQGER